jgi:hypothetical protein
VELLGSCTTNNKRGKLNMGKYVQTELDDMPEPLMPNGTYPLVIDRCTFKPGKGWGDEHPEANVFSWMFSVDEDPSMEVDEEWLGKTMTENTPDAKGIAKQLKRYLNGLGETPDTFDPNEIEGTKVWGSVGQGKAFGEPCNKVWEITLRD